MYLRDHAERRNTPSMNTPDHLIETERLVLRPWRASDLGSFSAMHADSEVMADQGGPLSAVESDAKLLRYCLSLRTHGYSRWCVVDRQETFVGYVGIVHHGNSGNSVTVHLIALPPAHLSKRHKA
jgi:RimJ/RimL family protein N-acetyltransferase